MNRPIRLLAPLLAACSLAACAVGPNTSYVAALSAPTDAQVLADGIGVFLTTQLPAASTTIILDPTPSDQASNTLTPVLADSLRQRGFAVADGSASAGGHTLRYWVTPLDRSGELVRLMIDGRKEASRFFVRNTEGNLQSGGPFTVRQTEASL
jgi:hypothetical protein